MYTSDVLCYAMSHCDAKARCIILLSLDITYIAPITFIIIIYHINPQGIKYLRVNLSANSVLISMRFCYTYRVISHTLLTAPSTITTCEDATNDFMVWRDRRLSTTFYLFNVTHILIALFIVSVSQCCARFQI